MVADLIQIMAADPLSGLRQHDGGHMPTDLSRDHRFCERVHRYVCTKRTEGQCRDANGCQEAGCPLEHEFGRDTTYNTARWFSINLGLSWLMPGRHDR